MNFLKKSRFVKLIAVFLAGTFLLFSTACSSATARDLGENPPQNGIYEDTPVNPPAKAKALKDNSVRNLQKSAENPVSAAKKAAQAAPENAKKAGDTAGRNLKQLSEEAQKRVEMIPGKVQEATEQAKDEARAL
ncbi:MAG: hypothetical protein SAJ12_05315 [Jaaginema sp. PMC 1079.18]|nr:hypothetical protein [Jaaginema sp. PMC 1080.18]MEC4850410.1 hypothetical protein [Jaaginema sp. PMC 1079.18]MEC4864746.1 hypothetical protein [Jaaginema sp. PMC 1078.18]